MRFAKMHGLGNDHVVVEACEFEWAVDLAAAAGISCPELVRRICNRHRGVGADGVLVVGESRAADVSMRVYNSDGFEAVMCGNGIRCVGKYAFEHGLVRTTDASVETGSGVHGLRLDASAGRVASVRVDMGVPGFPGDAAEEVVSLASKPVRFTHVSMGNPHAVMFIDGLVEDAPLEELAHGIASCGLFPDGVNVEVAHAREGGRVLSMRVFERGCGETAACGTGACAAAVAYRLRAGGSVSAGGHLEVRMPGGSLFVEWEAPDRPVFMSGPAEQVFEGEVDVLALCG